MTITRETMRIVIGTLTLVGALVCVLAIILGNVDRQDLAAIAGLVTLLINQSATVVRHLFPGGSEKEKP